MAFIVAAVVNFLRPEDKGAIGKLDPKAKEYAAASGAQTDGEPHLTGRIVPIDVGEKQVEGDVYDALPSDLRARSPREVSTVVKIMYRKKVVGHYGSPEGEDAIQESAELTIVDLRGGQQYGGKTIDGPSPPASKRSNESGSGGPPDPSDISDYLKSLPRLPAPAQ